MKESSEGNEPVHDDGSSDSESARSDEEYVSRRARAATRARRVRKVADAMSSQRVLTAMAVLASAPSLVGA